MKNKTMERMKSQEALDIETLFGRLLNRQMFAWENKSRTIGRTIIDSSQLRTRETLEQLRRNINTETGQVIEKISGRAGSWGYGKYLDHSRLLETRHLTNY